jgi:exopolyphosphatase / guanosine-5'-triphosphate,3'-diphosphate pyrophosphatase
MRVATIDIGTNAVLLLVAESGPDGSTRAVVDRATITRLGEGVDRSRTLSPAAIARTRSCLETYASVARELGAERVAVVGTSAMRDAHGGDELRAAIHSLFGVEVRVLSGEDEARMTFAGGLDGLHIQDGTDVGLFDIGGGSTEVVVGRTAAAEPSLTYVESFDIGSVRLTERHVFNDPPTEAEIESLCQSARDTFARVPPLPPGTIPIGVAGTMTTLAAIAIGLTPYVGDRVHGLLLSRERLAQVVRELAQLDVSSRRNVAGMEPKRADVIVAGGHVALALLELWHAPAVRISDRGLRWGLAHALLRKSSG